MTTLSPSYQDADKSTGWPEWLMVLCMIAGTAAWVIVARWLIEHLVHWIAA